MKRIGWAVMTVLALIIAAYAMALLFVPAMRAPFLQQRFLTISWAAYLHLGGSGLALAVGAFQHNGRIRARFIDAHRWLGRTYVVGVLLGGSAALALATISQAGLVTHAGFGLLAVLWLLSTGMAYRYIRSGNQALHRRWMIRSYALTFAAVTLRIYLPCCSSRSRDCAGPGRPVEIGRPNEEPKPCPIRPPSRRALNLRPMSLHLSGRTSKHRITSPAPSTCCMGLVHSNVAGMARRP